MSTIIQNHTHNEVMISYTPVTAKLTALLCQFLSVLSKKYSHKGCITGRFCVSERSKIVRDIDEISY